MGVRRESFRHSSVRDRRDCSISMCRLLLRLWPRLICIGLWLFGVGYLLVWFHYSIGPIICGLWLFLKLPTCGLVFGVGWFFYFGSLGWSLWYNIMSVEAFCVKFTRNNYSTWEFQFKMFLKGNKILGHIDWSSKASEDAKDLSAWETKDAYVIS